MVDRNDNDYKSYPLNDYCPLALREDIGIIVHILRINLKEIVQEI